MTDQASSPGRFLKPAHSSSARAPVCPACQQRMNIKTVAPVLFAGNFDDVIYVCGVCGTETKRTVERT